MRIWPRISGDDVGDENWRRSRDTEDAFWDWHRVML
jgi:hypothetical protein